MSRSRRPLRALIGVATATALAVPAAASASVDLLTTSAPLAPVSTNVGCDSLDEAACLLPFPNDIFTTEDASTDTGRRIDFLPTEMPRTGTEVTEGGEGKPVDPTEWNRNDGFSPGQAILTYVEGLDLHQTWGTQDREFGGEVNGETYWDYRDQITDIGLSLEEDSPIVVIDTETGEPHPVWAELDTHPGAVEAGEQVLIVRPAVNWTEGHRYIVALRNLKTADGSVIAPGEAFAAIVAGTSEHERQHDYNDSIFPTLEKQGIEREELYLAWDFTVASERNLSERMLHMRDVAFAQLNDTDLGDRKIQGDSPAFVVDATSERTDRWTDSHGVEHTQQVRRIEGRVTVPNFMDRIQQTEGHVKANDLPYDAPAPGSRLLDLDNDGLPDQNPVESTVEVPFMCDLPLNGEKNVGVLYGHGLLGDRGQLGDLKSPRRNGPFWGCAADWWGMSSPDLPTVAAILTDISHFPSLPDRAQQGFLNFMFLGRAMAHEDGFAADENFQHEGAAPIKTATPSGQTFLHYDGNSQGGIMGGALVAVSPDIHRAILGVPGMNYSTLLNRSVDWEGELTLEADIPAYAVPYYETYRDPIERQLGFQLIQMLWDRGEANGYAAHMASDHYENTPKHEIMLQVAFSDHQVANISAEVEARTIGAPIMQGLGPNRHWDFINLEPWQAYPYEGSALIYWDSGNGTPPNGNIPPHHSGDPHGHPRSEPAAGWQEAHFLLTGWMVDVCDGGHYLTDDHPANLVDGNKVASCKEPAVAPGYEDGVSGE